MAKLAAQKTKAGKEHRREVFSEVWGVRDPSVPAGSRLCQNCSKMRHPAVTGATENIQIISLFVSIPGLTWWFVRKSWNLSRIMGQN